MGERKVIVIGIDAASWNAIIPHISRLPTFRMFIEKGCCGYLESCIPPVTFPAWKCYSTGKNPSKLGIYWWADVDWGNQRFVFHNSKSFKDWEIWDYLNGYGYKVGIINMPTTYPPKKVNGFCIAGMPAEDSAEYTYPRALKRELIEKFNYRIHPKNDIYPEIYNKKPNKEKILNEIFKLIETRFKVAKYFIDDLDFLHLTIFYSDFVHHFFSDDKNIIFKLYKKIDEKLKNLIDAVDLKNTYILLMSDHGQAVFKYTFRINEWLCNKNYLSKQRKFIFLFGKLISIDNIIPIINKLGLNYLVDYFPRNIIKKFKLALPKKFGSEEFEIMNLIDIEKSIVFAVGYSIYINKDYFNNKRDYNRYVRDLLFQLKTLRNPFNGKKVFDTVLLTKKVYSNPKGHPPDIFYIPNPVNHIFCGISPFNEKVWTDGRIWKWVSDHTLFGIFGIIGPDIKKGYNINPKIFDLAPTILHIFDLPIPNDMDGRVLKEVFEEDSRFTKKAIEYEDPLKMKTKKAISKLRLGGKV